MTNLGLSVRALHYDATANDRELDDVEAVLPGPTPDSIIVIVHYDSIGPPGDETNNPGADDDMSGMAIELETARLFVEHASQLGYTIRFVAADAEELGDLAGARAYAAQIKAESLGTGSGSGSASGAFQLVAAVDDEQSGWACHTDGGCEDNVWPAFDVYTCGTSNDGQRHYSFPELGTQFTAITTKYSPMHVVHGCMGENSDHFAMWEVGIPAVVYSEHDPLLNDHFDQNGGDLFSRIDQDYLVSIARPAITFQAALAGIQSPE
jgi:Zn-dependent M28 family amino/carboxypeptidase